MPAGGTLCRAGGCSAGGSCKFSELVIGAPIGDSQDGTAKFCSGAQVDELFDPAKQVDFVADEGQTELHVEHVGILHSRALFKIIEG